MLTILVIYSGGFSQEIPSAVPWQKVSGPPILPPHLLQVILNKDTPVSVIFMIFFFFCNKYMLHFILSILIFNVNAIYYINIMLL